MSDFSLRETIRAALNATDEADPGVIADSVLQSIPVEAYRDALSQSLRLFVRQVISETRTSNHPSNVTPIRTFGRSSKVAAIREGWQRRLRDRVHVGNSEWKQLADCTYDDLLAVAGERQQLADRNSAWAREYRAMASAVLDANVETFGDLPAERQMILLGGAA